MNAPDFIAARQDYKYAFHLSKEDRDNKVPLAAQNLDEALKQHLTDFRLLVGKLGKACAESFLKTQCAEQFPDVTHGQKKVDSFKHALKAYHELQDSEKKKKFARFVMHEVWGSNDYATEVEEEILDLVKWKYHSGKLCNGTPREREAKGGNIRLLLVKKKTGLVEKFSNNLKETELLTYYVRNRKLDEKKAGEETTPQEQVLADSTARKVPRLVKQEKLDPQELRGPIVGYCKGHKNAVIDLTGDDGPEEREEQAATEKAKKDLLELLKKNANSESPKSMEDLWLALATKLDHAEKVRGKFGPYSSFLPMTFYNLYCHA